jgi:hypothetical protein
VSVVGLYVNAPASDLINWLEAWLAQPGNQVILADQAIVQFAQPQKAMVLAGRLVVQVAAPLTRTTIREDADAVSVAFHFAPVGLGTGTVILGTVTAQVALPLLVRWAAAVMARWPEAQAWFGEPSSQPTNLCALKVPAKPPSLEHMLGEFAGHYATADIRSMGFYPVTNATSPHGTEPTREGGKHWAIHLSLQTDGQVQGISQIELVAVMSSSPQKPETLLTLQRYGFVFPEIAPFTNDLVAFTYSRWPDTQVLGPDKPDNRRSREPSRSWTLVDKPWEAVANVAWDRLLLMLWWQDEPAARIGERIGVTAKTVINRLSELRKRYGVDLVPTETNRRARVREKLGRPGR